MPRQPRRRQTHDRQQPSARGGRAPTLACRHCERHGRYNICRLIERHGAEMGLPQLMTTLSADCPHQQPVSIYDRCGFHLPGGINPKLTIV
jgi:hypothetical protein